MIDTHCHIDDSAYLPDWDEMIVRQQQNGVEAIVVPGVDETSLPGIENLCSRYSHWLYPAYGLHPENIQSDGTEQLLSIKKAIKQAPNLVAIGEIGLDYHYAADNKEVQKKVYRSQLQWAREMDLPVIIHCRDAIEDTLKITKEVQNQFMNQPARTGVIHCFSASKEIAKQWLNMGFYIGIGGVVTFKKCQLPETLKYVPLNNIVLETDGPYMTPVPLRGKRNESYFIKYVIEKLQTIYNQSYEEIERQTSDNARRLFNLTNP